MTRPEFLLLLSLLLFAPLAFGTVEPWSRAVVETGALASLAIALRRRTHGGRLRLRSVPGAAPLLLYLGLLLLQAAPLPPGLVRLLSPSGHAVWNATLGASGPLPWVPLTVDPLATLREFVRLSACAAVYVLAVQLLARGDRLRAATTVLIAFAALLSFAALMQALVAPERLLFVRAAPPGRPFGPYVNRNHYANLMAMLLPLALGLFLARHAPSPQKSARGRLADALALREGNLRLLTGFAALLAASSLVVTLSRGATVAAAFAVLVLGGCLGARGIARRSLVAALLLGSAFAVFTGWFGWERVAEHFSKARDNPGLVDSLRAAAWRDTARMARDYLATGAGAGAFERLYPRYRSAPGDALAHPHNDYLELLACTGIPGLVLFLWFAAAVLRAVLRLVGRRREPAAVGLACGAFAGCVAFLAHSAGDFSLAIGANAVVFFFLLALAVSAAATLGRGEEESLLPRTRLPSAATAAAVALAAGAAILHAGALTAERAWGVAGETAGRAEALRVPPASARSLVALAARLSPLDGAYPSALARIAAREGDLVAAVRLSFAALRRRPLDPGTLRQLGGFLAARGDAERARRTYESAVVFGPADPLNHLAHASWLLGRGETDAALSRLRAAIELDPARTPSVIALLVLSGFTDERIAAAIPARSAALVRFARYLETTGSPGLAAARYRDVLALEPGNAQAREGLRRAAGVR